MSFGDKKFGYVLAINQKTVPVCAALYCKNYPTIDIFFQWSKKLSDTLKPGNLLQFTLPDDFQQSDLLFPEDQKLRSYNKNVERLYPEETSKYSQVQFITNAIFTIDPNDDNALRKKDIFAVGFSNHFGRFVVTKDFDNSDNIEFAPGKLYKVAISRYLKSGQKKFSAWKTMMVCDKVFSVDEDYESVNLLQEQCSWSQNLSPIIPPKKVVDPEAQINKSKITKVVYEKDSESGIFVSFGLAIEQNEKFTLIFVPTHRSFYRVKNKPQLIPGSVYSLKLSDEVDGIFQKVCQNKIFHMDTIRSITRGIIEATFEVKLCRITNPTFPNWTLYGDTKYLGKVMIPECEDFPEIGSNLMIRAIFLNKPRGDFCWTFIGISPSSRQSTPTVDREVTVEKDTPPKVTVDVKKDILTKITIDVKKDVLSKVSKPNELTRTSSTDSSFVIVDMPTKSDSISVRSSREAPINQSSDEFEDEKEPELNIYRNVSEEDEKEPEWDIYQDVSFESGSDNEFDEGEVRFGTGEEEAEPNAFIHFEDPPNKNLESQEEELPIIDEKLEDKIEEKLEDNAEENLDDDTQECYGVAYLDKKSRSQILVTPDSENEEDELDISICSGLHSDIEDDESIPQIEAEIEDPMISYESSSVSDDKDESKLEEIPTDPLPSAKTSNSARNAASSSKKFVPKSSAIVTQDSSDEQFDSQASTTDEEF